MSVFDTIELKKSDFTKTDMQVYNTISKDFTIVFHESSNSLARKTGLSQASIMRFCRRLGYSGYNDFRFALYDAMHTGKTMKSDKQKSMTRMDCYKSVMDELEQQMENGDYNQFADDIMNSSFIVTSGSHRSSLPAQLLSMEMRLLNKWAVYLPVDQNSGWPKGTSGKDIFVLFSESSDGHRNICEMMSSLPDGERPTMYLICMNPKHPLRKMFDHVIRLPWPSHEDLPYRVDPSTVFMVFTDLVTSMIADRQEAQNENQ